MSNKLPGIIAAFWLLAATPTVAQSVTHKVNLPPDSPVAYLNVNMQNRPVRPRGGASQIDLNATLTLRNVSQKRIRSIVLTVEASDLTVGGKGAVSLPSLSVRPGENFTVPIEMSLLRPPTIGPGQPTVEIRLDGLLFDDLTFFGPDTRNSKRTMMLWELEARRDREHFKQVLAKDGKNGLQQEMKLAIARQGMKRPGVQVAQARATVLDAGKEMAFAFVEMPDSPVAVTNGTAHVTDNTARDPRFAVLNRSPRTVDHVEIGWIVKDQQGREFMAASLGADVRISPNQTVKVNQDTELRLDRPVEIQGMTGYVSSVQYEDGSLWIPSNLAHLRQLVPPSPEVQRLMQIYTRRGIESLVEELK